MVRVRSVMSVIFLIALFVSDTAHGKDLADKEPRQIRLIAGRFFILDVAFNVKNVSLGDPTVVYVDVLSPRQIYLLGKNVGGTNLLVKGDDQQMLIDLVVGADLSSLKEQLSVLLPNEKIDVFDMKESIILKGEVSSTSALNMALSIGENFAKGKVVNLMQAGGLQQVMLEVKISEVSRSALNRLGINLASVVKDSFFGFTNLGGAVPITSFELALPNLTLNNIELSPSSSNNLFFGVPRNHIIGFIDALKQNGLGKILAEPNLMAVSGREATFLAGGEFPVPVPQSGATSNTITIEYKKFGVQLKFTPIVLNSEKISLQVTQEVSDLDFSTAIQVSGFVIPSITSRSASTTVELMDGHTLAIAGLIREDVKDLISKFPILGDIPIIGALFRSTSFQKNETELLVLVTPHLVKSLGTPETVSLPTDQFPEYERELMGLWGWGKKKPVPSAPRLPGGLEGEFGHSE